MRCKVCLKIVRHPAKKNKGGTSLRLLSERSSLELHDAVSTRVVKGYSKKCCNKNFQYTTQFNRG